MPEEIDTNEATVDSGDSSPTSGSTKIPQPKDGCTTKFLFAYLKDGKWWEDSSQAPDQETLMELRLPKLVAIEDPDDIRMIVRITTETFVEV